MRRTVWYVLGIMFLAAALIYLLNHHDQLHLSEAGLSDCKPVAMARMYQKAQIPMVEGAFETPYVTDKENVGKVLYHCGFNWVEWF